MQLLLKKASGTLGLRVFYTLLTFITNVALARLLSQGEFGTYTLTTASWLYVLTIPTTLGFDGLIGRELSIYQVQKDWPRMSGLLQWSNQLVALLSGVTAIVGIVIALWWNTQEGNALTQPTQLISCFILVLATLPAMALRNVRRGAMRGLHQIVRGLFSEMVLAPLLLIWLIGIGSIWLKDDFSATWAVSAYTLTTLITLLTSTFFLEKAIPPPVKKARTHYDRFDWVKKAWPFMFLESISVLNARSDILMLGALNGVEASAIYEPVSRGAHLIIFILMAFNGPLSPTIANLYTEGHKQKLQQLLTKTARICLVISAVAATGLLLLGKQYLLLFGPEYVQGLSALKILCIGQVLFVFVGLSPMVLSMTGYAKFTAISGFIGVVANLVLNFVLIPRYGVNGAAIATTTAALCAGAMNAFWVYKKVGLRTSILG